MLVVVEQAAVEVDDLHLYLLRDVDAGGQIRIASQGREFHSHDHNFPAHITHSLNRLLAAAWGPAPWMASQIADSCLALHWLLVHHIYIYIKQNNYNSINKSLFREPKFKGYF